METVRRWYVSEGTGHLSPFRKSMSTVYWPGDSLHGSTVSG